MFYPSSAGDCVSVQYQINNCLFYQSQNQCGQCQPGYILSSDQLECFNDRLVSEYIDPNCQDQAEQPGLNCQLCSQGFYLDQKGNCVPCKGDAIVALGCYYCDYLNPTVCIACGSGFYMDTTGAC